MINTTQTEDGRFTATVGAYRTPSYITRQMAEADAKCWAAFNGEGSDMIEIADGEEFDTHQSGSGLPIAIDAVGMRRRIAEALKFGCDVFERQGTERRYIQIGRNGSSYGQYFRKVA